jgi:hypothetical protein
MWSISSRTNEGAGQEWRHFEKKLPSAAGFGRTADPVDWNPVRVDLESTARAADWRIAANSAVWTRCCSGFEARFGPTANALGFLEKPAADVANLKPTANDRSVYRPEVRREPSSSS